MRLVFPWTDWLKQRSTQEPVKNWDQAEVTLAEELYLEISLRSLLSECHEEDFPDFLSGIIRENFRLQKIIKQAKEMEIQRSLDQ